MYVYVPTSSENILCICIKKMEKKFAVNGNIKYSNSKSFISFLSKEFKNLFRMNRFILSSDTLHHIKWYTITRLLRSAKSFFIFIESATVDIWMTIEHEFYCSGIDWLVNWFIDECSWFDCCINSFYYLFIHTTVVKKCTRNILSK